MKKRVIILGSTGSIGRSALDVIRRYPDRFEAVAIGTHSNVELLAEQTLEFNPKWVAVADPVAGARLRDLGLNAEIVAGPDAMSTIAQQPADIVLCGMVGAVGLRPVLAAIHAGNRVALANKEPLVMAGHVVTSAAKRHNVEVLPVDSEHNAIFQCLHGHNIDDVYAIHLTASGGPFYTRSRATLAGVMPEEAAKHPTWNMGRKISVDSATLMNKGLEVIEAMWLFQLPLDKIHVVIHPQSIVHSLVEFVDGSILAHLGLTDMKFPIMFALAWPERLETPMGRLDLTRMRELTFAAPDFSEFPCLKLALDAARTGGTAPALLNAANEAAVEAFCDHRISFLQISEVVEQVLSEGQVLDDTSLDNVLASDAEGRRLAARIIETSGAYRA